MVNLEQTKLYLKIDFEDDDTFISTLIDTSLIYIDSMVGEAYKTDEKAVALADLLQLLLISEMYDTRGVEVPSATKTNRIVSSILDKLSLYEP